MNDGLSTDACIKLIKKDVEHIKGGMGDIKELLTKKVDKTVCFEREKAVTNLAEGQKQLQRFVWGVLASTVLLLISIILTHLWSK